MYYKKKLSFSPEDPLKGIIVVGMLDEREEVLGFIKNVIEKRGHRPILIDISIGTGGIDVSLKPDVTREEIAKEGGSTEEEIDRLLFTQRDKVVRIMAIGLSKKVLELYKNGEAHGIIAISGLTGTLISLQAMTALPFGFPKVLLSSACAMPAYAKSFSEYFGTADITVLHTVVDMIGVNSLVLRIAANGANAICGMVEGKIEIEKKRPLLAITEFGFCEKAARYIRELMKEKYEIISFHAQGLGDKAACELAKKGTFEVFVDLVPAGFSEFLFGGNRSAGPDRLDVAKDLDIPYIITPCGFDMISCGPLERKDKDDKLWISRKLKERKLFIQDEMRVQARTTREEMEEIAKKVAEKLNDYKNKGKVKFLIPRKGFSSLSTKEGPFFDPEADLAFIDSLKKLLSKEIEIIEIDTDINSLDFARAVKETIEKIS